MRTLRFIIYIMNVYFSEEFMEKKLEMTNQLKWLPESSVEYLQAFIYE